MAKHSYERARWNRREARRRVGIGTWPYAAGCWPCPKPRNGLHFNKEECWQDEFLGTRRRLNDSMHGCLSKATRRYRRLWRRRAHEIGRLHVLGAHDDADNLDPQPRRLGVMRDIW